MQLWLSMQLRRQKDYLSTYDLVNSLVASGLRSFHGMVPPNNKTSAQKQKARTFSAAQYAIFATRIRFVSESSARGQGSPPHLSSQQLSGINIIASSTGIPTMRGMPTAGCPGWPWPTPHENRAGACKRSVRSAATELNAPSLSICPPSTFPAEALSPDCTCCSLLPLCSDSLSVGSLASAGIAIASASAGENKGEIA